MKKGRIFPIEIESAMSMFDDRNCIIIVGKGAGDHVGKLQVKEILGLVVIRETVNSLT